MLKQLLTFALVALFVFNVGSPAVLAQRDTGNNPQNTEKVKAAVLKRSGGKKRRVTVTMRDGTKMKGYVSQPNDDSFVLTDSKTGQATNINYQNVSQVKSNLSTENKILIGIGIGAIAAAAIVYLGYVVPYCRNEGC